MKSVHALSRVSIATLFLLMSCQPPAVQKEIPPKTIQNIPTLDLKTKKYAIPPAIKKQILAKGLAPERMTVLPRKELKSMAEQWKQKKQIPLLNPNFAIQQLIPPLEDQVSCDWGSMNICGYETVGNWTEYYDAMYSPGFQEELCVYEQKEYCAYSEDQSCHISYNEMQFQGCDCPEGYEKKNNSCEKTYALNVFYDENTSPLNALETLELSPLDQNGVQDVLRVKIEAPDFQRTSFEIKDINENQVFLQDGYGSNDFFWRGENNDGLTLPNGLYTIILSTDEQAETRFQIRLNNPDANQLTLNLQHQFTTITPNSVPLIFPPSSDQYLTFLINANEHWVFEIKDIGGSTVYFKKGLGNQSFDWSGTDQNGRWVPQGTYMAHVKTSTQSVSRQIKTGVLSGVEDIELYHSADIQKLLDSAEMRLVDMQFRVEELMEQAQASDPSYPAFEAKAIEDPAIFRIQQQSVVEFPVVDIPDASYFPEPADDDVPKEQLDAQNDRILKEVALLRQKIAWLENFDEPFQIQSTSSGSIRSQAGNLGKGLTGITYSQGCVDYYSFKPKHKRKRKKRNNNACYEFPGLRLHNAMFEKDGGIFLRGRVNGGRALCSAFDYSILTPEIEGITVTGTPQITRVSDYGDFEIRIADGDYTIDTPPDFSTQIYQAIAYCLLTVSARIAVTAPRLNLVSNSMTVRGLLPMMTSKALQSFPYFSRILQTAGIRTQNATSVLMNEVFRRGVMLPRFQISMNNALRNDALKRLSPTELTRIRQTVQSSQKLTAGQVSKLESAVAESVTRVRVENFVTKIFGKTSGVRVAQAKGFSPTDRAQIDVDGLIYKMSGDTVRILGFVENKSTPVRFGSQSLSNLAKSSIKCSDTGINQLLNIEARLLDVINNGRSLTINGKEFFKFEVAPNQELIRIVTRHQNAGYFASVNQQGTVVSVPEQLAQFGWMPMRISETTADIASMTQQMIQKGIPNYIP